MKNLVIGLLLIISISLSAITVSARYSLNKKNYRKFKNHSTRKGVLSKTTIGNIVDSLKKDFISFSAKHNALLWIYVNTHAKKGDVLDVKLKKEAIG